MKPRVSVVVPSFNCAAYLPKAINSVLSQTYQDFELIVVDDASQDETQEVVSRYLGDKRVRYVRLPENRGPSAARNAGISEAAGELLAFLDADDYWAPAKLQAQVAALTDEQADVCAVGAWLLVPNGRKVVTKKQPFAGDDLYRQLLFRNSIPGSSSSIMLRRQCIESVGYFDESLRGVEDRDMWARLAASCRFLFLDTPLVYIDRRRSDSAVSGLLMMAFSRQAFLQKRENDIPPHLRYLLPDLRRATYLFMARRYWAVGDRAACRKYCIRTIMASARRDRRLTRAISLLIRAMLPSSMIAAQMLDEASLPSRIEA